MRTIWRHPVVRRSGRLLLAILVAVFVLRLVGDLLASLRDAGVRPDWAAMLWSVPLLALSRLGELEGWFRLVVRHGQERLAAARIFAVGELFRYLPGGVVHLGARYKLGRGAGLEPAQVVAATGVDLALRLAVALGTFVVTLPLWHDLPVVYVVGSLALVPLLLACASPPVVRRVMVLVQRKVGGEPVHLPYAVVLRAAGWFTVSSLLRGMGLWATLAAVVPIGAGALPAVVGVAALAWAAGVVVPFSPGGLGVREAVGIALLTPLVGVDVATLGMLANRLAWVGAEVLVAAPVEILHRWRSRPEVVLTSG